LGRGSRAQSRSIENSCCIPEIGRVFTLARETWCWTTTV